jgi:hypothetical protein
MNEKEVVEGTIGTSGGSHRSGNGSDFPKRVTLVLHAHIDP